MRSHAGGAVRLWALCCGQAIVCSRLVAASPAAGLVTAGAIACLYAMLAAGRATSFVHSGALCAIIGAALSAVPEAQAAGSLAALALLTTGMLLLAAALRSTIFQRLFPEPVSVGFFAGTGITIIVAEGAGLVLNGPASLAVGVGSLALLLTLRRLGSTASVLLVVVALATAASDVFHLQRHGVRVIGEAATAFVPAGVAVLLDPRALGVLLPAAFGIAVLASARPLVAEGADLSPTAGARTGPAARRLAAVAAAVSIVGVAHGEVLAPLPQATLSAILLVVCLGWVDARRLSELRRASPRDFRLALVAAFGVTILGPRWGLAVGVAAALGDALHQAHQAGFLSAVHTARAAARADALPLDPGARSRRRERHRWVRAPWSPRRRALRRSAGARDASADGAGIKARAVR